MAYDPNKPQENTPLDAAEMRNQFNALKTFLDTHQAQIAALQAQVSQILTQGAALAQQISTLPTQAMVNAAITGNSAANADAVQPLEGTPSDPPTQVDVMGLMYKVNELITTVHR